MNPKFLPKMHSSFQINEPIHLPTFSPKPHANTFESTMHTLDVRRALSFYLDRTKLFRTSPKLFVSIAERSRGTSISNQRLSNWIVGCIRLCYQLKNMTSPTSVRAHSTRSMLTSVAFLRYVSLTDICKADTWASEHTFAKHCILTHGPLTDTRKGWAVLSTAFLPDPKSLPP